MTARPLAAALVVAASVAAPARAGEPGKPAFTRDAYYELIRSYARGERPQAVAALGAWSERDLARQLASVEDAARALERCPSCPNSLAGLPLKAAVMLHWDRDRAEQPPRAGVEQPQACPGPLATIAGRFARVLARNVPQDDFARRFFRMVVTSCQWDACFEAAERWAGEAIALYPLDAELLLTRGSVREESATLTTRESPAAGVPGSVEPSAEAVRREGWKHARRDLEEALRLDPGLGLARLRLGRVLWRLGEPEPARQQLEQALPSLRATGHVYLAHLFLGRTQQDAGRLDEAIGEYRLAVALHPSALSAAVALSSALRLAGDADAGRSALRQGLESAGRRRGRDPHWDYQVVNAVELASLLDELYRETLE
jgi:tetratricopeptide (TPR) repeat protein